MWTAKISFDGKNALIGSRTLKHHINLFGFPLSYFYKKNYIIVNIAGILVGEEKNKKKFVEDLKSSPRLLNFELNNDFFIAIIKEPEETKTIYNSNIIHLSPALIDENGNETIALASFNKKYLNKALTTLEKIVKAKILSFKEEKVKSISIAKENPQLTKKQKLALQLAIKQGYYEYPRQVKLEQLAKISNLSYSTFQAHLRKAEKKLLPFYFENK